jgi:hypothetical protein
MPFRDAANIDVDHRVPVLHLQRRERRQRHDASIVDQHVDAAEARNRVIDERLHVRAAGDVERTTFGGAARGNDFGGECFEPVGAACAEEQFRAGGGKFARRRSADTAARAGDQDDFIGSGGHDRLHQSRSALCRPLTGFWTHPAGRW